MYRNLKIEMAKAGVSRRDLSELLGVRYATIIDKLNGKYNFTLDEAFKIQMTFFEQHSIEYLFQDQEDRLA